MNEKFNDEINFTLNAGHEKIFTVDVVVVIFILCHSILSVKQISRGLAASILFKLIFHAFSSFIHFIISSIHLPLGFILFLFFFFAFAVILDER
jgi:hypothetical protein